MFGDLGKKIEKTKAEFHTYSVGLLQAKAFRVLKNETSQYLKPFALTTVDWAFLGILYHSKQGENPSDLARLMGVKAPYVTRIIQKMQKKRMISVSYPSGDKRIKMITLTKEGRAHVKAIETDLRLHMRSVMKGASMRDILGYIAVLKHLVANGSDEAVDDPYQF